MEDTPTYYGLREKGGELWLGNGEGPFAFEDKSEAMLAAMVASRRLNQSIRAYPIPPESMVLRDEVPTHMSGEEAIRQLEQGFLAP